MKYFEEPAKTQLLSIGSFKLMLGQGGLHRICSHCEPAKVNFVKEFCVKLPEEQVHNVMVTLKELIDVVHPTPDHERRI